eukprot:8341878-Pyramimonas_sp.AAC.3
MKGFRSHTPVMHTPLQAQHTPLIKWSPHPHTFLDSSGVCEETLAQLIVPQLQAVPPRCASGTSGSLVRNRSGPPPSEARHSQIIIMNSHMQTDLRVMLAGPNEGRAA